MQAALVVLAAASKTKAAGGSFATLLVIGVFAVAVYYFFVRPRSKRTRQVREQVRGSEVGDRIVTIGGLVGTIVSESGDEVTISTGNGVEVTYLRQAIGKKLEPTTDETTIELEPGFEGPAPDTDTPAQPEEHEAT